MRLGITRDVGQLTDLKRWGKEQGVDVIALRATSLTPIPFSWPQDLALSEVDWIVFTSANAVRSFFERIDELGMSPDASTRYAVIGAKTAQALQTRGCRPGFQSPVASGQDLFTSLMEQCLVSGDTVVYVRGKDVATDPQRQFLDAGLLYYPIVCYETKAVSIDAATVKQFGESDYICFTAPSSVDSFHDQFGAPQARPVAIGETTAARMRRHGWQRSEILATPDVDSILEHIQCN